MFILVTRLFDNNLDQLSPSGQNDEPNSFFLMSVFILHIHFYRAKFDVLSQEIRRKEYKVFYHAPTDATNKVIEDWLYIIRRFCI